MQFDEAVQYLLSLGHETLAMKLGLANVARLLAALDNPQRAYPAVQLAGTNGKGSTAALLDAVCRAAHLRTGLYTSPHLSAITERIKLSGHDLAPAEFAQHATRVRAAAEQLHGDQSLLGRILDALDRLRDGDELLVARLAPQLRQ